jgi:hypothetical protein
VVFELFGFLFLSLMSIIDFYLRKCHQNNGKCKVRIINYSNMHIINVLSFQWSWFTPKTPENYERRREVGQSK